MPTSLSDLIRETALPTLQQYNDVQAKEPVTDYVITSQIRIAIPKQGEDVDQSCFEQLWTATARDGTQLSQWRTIPTLEAKNASKPTT